MSRAEELGMMREEAEEEEGEAEENGSGRGKAEEQPVDMRRSGREAEEEGTDADGGGAK